MIFAYMGPPDKAARLPRYDVLENSLPGEFIEADGNSIGSGGPVIVPCNWLQHFENVMDPFHVPILHGSFSGNQFTAKMAVMPKVKFEYTERGTRSMQLRDIEGGVHRRITEAVLPTIRAVANPRADKEGPCTLLGWVSAHRRHPFSHLLGRPGDRSGAIWPRYGHIMTAGCGRN